MPPHALQNIFGFLYIPRIMIVSLMTAGFWETNSTLIVICWIIAIILDLFGNIVKIGMMGTMMKAAAENMG